MSSGVTRDAATPSRGVRSSSRKSTSARSARARGRAQREVGRRTARARASSASRAASARARAARAAPGARDADDQRARPLRSSEACGVLDRWRTVPRAPACRGAPAGGVGINPGDAQELGERLVVSPNTKSGGGVRPPASSRAPPRAAGCASPRVTHGARCRCSSARRLAAAAGRRADVQRRQGVLAAGQLAHVARGHVGTTAQHGQPPSPGSKSSEREQNLSRPACRSRVRSPTAAPRPRRRGSTTPRASDSGAPRSERSRQPSSSSSRLKLLRPRHQLVRSNDCVDGFQLARDFEEVCGQAGGRQLACRDAGAQTECRLLAHKQVGIDLLRFQPRQMLAARWPVPNPWSTVSTSRCPSSVSPDAGDAAADAPIPSGSAAPPGSARWSCQPTPAPAGRRLEQEALGKVGRRAVADGLGRAVQLPPPLMKMERAADADRRVAPR